MKVQVRIFLDEGLCVMVDDLLLLVVKHRVESEIRSTISRKEGGGSQKERHRSHV